MKRILKLLISLLVYTGDTLLSAVARFFGKPCPGTCAVLYYHEVVEAERDRFARQLDVICRAARPVSALDLNPFTPGKKHVAITVDDAFVSFFRNGLPEIEQRKIPVLVFVPTAWLGKKVDWGMEEVMASPNECVATLAELQQHARHPLIKIGSHTCNHRKLSDLDDADALSELGESKKFLERELGDRVESISFPYGGFSDRDTSLAGQSGYQMCFSTRPAIVTEKFDRGVIGRFRIDPSDWLLEAKLKAAGAYRWQSGLQRLRARFRNHDAGTAAKISAASA